MGLAAPPRVPNPLNDYLQVVEAPGGPITLHVRQWLPAQASRCRLCAVCMREDGPYGQTVCVVAWPGRQTAESVARLERDSRGLEQVDVTDPDFGLVLVPGDL